MAGCFQGVKVSAVEDFVLTLFVICFSNNMMKKWLKKVHISL